MRYLRRRFRFIFKSLENAKENSFNNYSDVHNIQDGLLFGDVFEEFIDVCLTNCQLDPAHYVTPPSSDRQSKTRF